ncbi:MAG: Ig-like domain-containing protein [Pirellulaceae bacterium]|nr:Ig-like domain-containing protein [Pirellulaceae bacterium]
MSTSRRPFPRRVRSLRRPPSPAARLRRFLGGAEQLEARTMMAADMTPVVSEYWNYQRPADVNNDGNISPQDLLAIINAMSARGMGSLVAPSGEGEQPGTGGGKVFFDPNNDNALNPRDLLFVINSMGEGEGPPFMVDYRITPVFQGTTTPITTPIQEGDFFELLVEVKDNGLTTYNGLTRPSEQTGFPGATNFGVFTPYIDVLWDTSQVKVQTNEAQVIKFTGTPQINVTTFTITFNGNTTTPILFRGNTPTTARAIQNALRALPGGNSSISGLSNFEVEPETGGGFRIRFLNSLSNQDVPTLGTALVTAGTATGISSTQVLAANTAASFKEAFEPRPVRDTSDPNIILNAGADPNEPWYSDSDLVTSGTELPNGVHQAGSAINEVYYLSGQPFTWPGNGFVEAFRVRMNVIEKTTTTPVTFTGDVTNLDASHVVSVVGFPGNPPAIAAGDIFITNTSINISEQVSASAVATNVNEDNLTGVSFTPTITDNFPLAGEVLGIVSFTPAANGTVTRTGNTLRYVPSANFNGTDTFTYTISDGTGGHTDTATVTITVLATNDPPVNNIPLATQNVNEDATGGSALTFGGGNAITITDIDSGTAVIQTTLTVSTDGSGAHGTLTMGSTNPPAVTGNGTGTLVITGTRDEINAGLSGLRFTPRPNFAGAATIRMDTTDNGATAAPANASVGTDLNDIININVVAINDPPVVTVPGAQIVDESVNLTFNAANSNLISVADIDAGTGQVTVVVSTTNLTGGLLNPAAGSGATITNPNSRSMSITGTLAQVNAALNGMTYFSSSPQNDTLTITPNDNGNTGAAGTPPVSATVQITVNPTVRPRAINDDSSVLVGTILEGSTTAVTLNVLANDLSNIDETRFFDGTPSLGSNPGTLSIQGTAPNQTLLYTPPGGKFYGEFTFEYTMRETDNIPVGGTQLPNNGPSTATVKIVITKVNDAPVGVADNYLLANGATEDVVFNVNAANGLLVNDTDADNLSAPFNAGLTVDTTSIVQPPAGQGTVSVNADGSFAWTPTPGSHFNGQTSFSYKVKDSDNLLSAATTVTIDVAAVPDNPIANADSYLGVNGATEDVVFNVSAVNGLLVNDTDPDNLSPPLNTGVTVDTTSIVQPPAGQGTVAVNPDGSFAWTPTPGADFNGQTSFTYRVMDGGGLLSAAATVTIDVAASNDAPVAGNATYSVGEGQTLNATGGSAGTGLLRFPTNPIVTDVDSSRVNLSVTLVSGPSEGTFNFNSNGSFSYTPVSGNPVASVTFTYTATDGLATSNVGTITINILAVNNAPTANNDTLTATEDQTLTIVAPGTVGNRGLLFNDTDPENDTLQIVNPGSIVLNGPGTLAVTADGSVTYTPPSQRFDSTAFATFTYQITDGINTSNAATVTINLNEVNDDPTANPDNYTAITNFTNQVIDVLTNDSNSPDVVANGPASDISGEVRIVQSLTALGVTVTRDGSGNTTDLTTTLGGKVRLVNGEVRYDSPPGAQNVTDSFDYTLSDGRGGNSTTTVTIPVINFVAKSISGTVFIDGNGDGLPGGPGDKPLAGIVVHLVGSDLLDPLNPITVNRTATTGADGVFLFTGVRPGSYDIYQDQPNFIRDGADTAPTGSLATRTGNDNFHASWPATNVVGNITGLLFVEAGLNPTDSDLLDSSGLYGEVLASSGSNGMVFNVDLGGSLDWMYCLPGWNNLRSATIVLQPGLASGTLIVTDLSGATYTRSIFQAPKNNTGLNNTPPAGSSARFRILGIGNSGEYLLRLDGTAADFGLTLAAAAVPAGGEGEAPMSDGEFARGADEVMAEGQWA